MAVIMVSWYGSKPTSGVSLPVQQREEQVGKVGSLLTDSRVRPKTMNPSGQKTLTDGMSRCGRLMLAQRKRTARAPATECRGPGESARRGTNTNTGIKRCAA